MAMRISCIGVSGDMAWPITTWMRRCFRGD
jgi:hypothetical protein